MSIGSWRTASANCRPSFVSFHRAEARFSNVATADSPYSSWRNIYSPAHSRGNKRIKSQTFLRLRASYTFAAAHNNTSSFASSEKELQPFTWPRLIDLFRPSNTQRNSDNNYIPSDHPNLELFRRSVAVQASYEQHKKYLDRFWKSAYDYLVVNKFGEGFGFEKVIVRRDGSEISNISNLIEDDGDRIPPNGPLCQSLPSLTQASKYTIENRLTYLSLVLNDFPYDVAEGIEHWCLWKIGGLSSTEGILRKELSWALKEIKDLPADENSGSRCIMGGKEQKLSFVKSRYSQKMPVQQAGPISDTLYWVNPPHLQSMPEIHHAHILVLRSDKSNGEGSEEKNETIPSPPPI
eukprot:CAMPEP_0172573530 /NCGR_PEP_ID=MMETSP1067-20121228/136238_1 /TAXON_ID=265564 ORGANISM="Thalassiosira punctigera, Strain Tpunct2005C2" /NCGR_SAMPLE_ID=MMETSP1067 /ASSEMBLY_ACC=CAM_ASM_000444 /LENGTH=349 /DNA_ID=CAMNT_0013366137 /DNA_START=233 /DNA_END=1282 /DNA_ORIENTATION=+